MPQSVYPPEAEVQGMDIHEHGEEGYGREFAGGISLQESTSNLRSIPL